MQIRKAAVLGAGVMGSGIAAHLANAGVDVELLDLKPEWAAGALKKAQKQRPAPFMNKRFSGRVRTGGFDEHMDRIADCQWVIEVVTENLQIKHSLYEKVLPHLHSDAWLTSNTSGIPLASLVENFDAEVKARFFITHFFNPARYMRLLEVIPGPDTSQENITAFNLFAERRLGKGVVLAKDTVNFIANRIGVHGMMLTLHKTIEMGYSVREVDVITGPATGRPSSATFKTADLVGLDTLAHVAKNCLDNLPHDEDRDLFAVPDVVTKLIESGATGRKAGAGFYKKVGRDILTLDFATGEYISVDKPKFDSIKKARSKSSVAERIAHVLGADDRAGAFARATILRSLAYSANRLGEIADDVRSIDDAMRWGFNWDMGPFELWQSIGVSKVNELMESEGVPVPQAALEAAKTGHWYPENEELGKPSPLQRAAKLGNVVASSHTTRTLDIGDGVLAFEFFTKMNSLDNSVVENLEKAIDLAESSSEWNGLVIANDAERFSVGANIMLIAMGIQSKNWAQIEQMTKMFQDAFQRMQRCSIPIVAAPHNLALGGGCEITLGADRIRAHSELYMGLVEVGVGLIPGAGGTLELLKRNLENVPLDRDLVFDRTSYIARTFTAIGMAKVSTSAFEARDLGYLRSRDAITFDRAKLVHDAKQDVLHLASTGYTPQPEADYLLLPGPNGAAVIEASLYQMNVGGFISEHDRLIGGKLARVLTGGDTDGRRAVTEQEILDLEREAFLSLCGEEKTLARINHMLKTNKPLRN